MSKHRWSSFHQTNLELSLRTAGVEAIVLGGGTLAIGIASTAYSARDHDISVIFLRDPITAGDPRLFDLFMNKTFLRIGLVRATDWFVQRLAS